MTKPYRLIIVGRPNVGKSTLFNRLLGRRRALVHDQPGVTRDRLEEKASWWVGGKSFPAVLVDTGGLGGEQFSEEISHQVKIAIENADLLLFIFDSQTGLTPLDQELLRELATSGVLDQVPTFGIVNKVDAEIHEANVADFFSLGMDEILTISAEHGRGIDDLKSAIAERLGFFEQDFGNESESESDSFELSDEEAEESDIEVAIEEMEAEETQEYNKYKHPYVARVAVVGRPNVGKSTLINAILGHERMITSPIAGTTVDAVDSAVEIDGKPFLFIDTAGIRRKAKTEQGIEVLSVVQTRKSLERADIAILVLDGETGITDQDEKIGGLIEEVGCGVVLVVNKWDTQRKNKEFTKEIAADQVRSKMAFLRYAPILFTSAIHGKGLEQLGDLLEEIMVQRRVKVSTHEFTEWVRDKATIHNPQNARFFLCHQTGRNPPTFVCHVNDPDRVHFSLRRHLVNSMRERWGYMGSPVRMLFKEAKNRKSLPRSK
jgi:GTPase